MAGLTLTGCHYTFDAEGTQCDSTAGCPTGFSCAADGLCHAARDGSGGGDGGASDSGAGGGVDGGGLLDGGADGGTDGGDDGGTDGGADGGSGLCDCTRSECDGLPCRLAASVCDVAEVCASGLCPVDEKATAGTLCAPGACMGSTREVPKTCDGSGGCRAGTPVDCSPFGCGNGVCLLSCQASTECSTGNYCNPPNGCVAQLDNGLTCTLDEQCLSSHCVDGVCCNGACAGACDACHLTGFVGECSAQSQGFAGSPACAHYLCDGSGTSCATTCATTADCVTGDYCTTQFTCVAKKANGAQCNAPGQCASDQCIDGVCCNSSCEGGCDRCNAPTSMGTCLVDVAGSPGANPSCAPFLCDGTNGACPMTCSASSQCANDAGCVGMACGGKLGDGQSCASRPASDCLSNFCSDGVCCNTACGGACDRCNLATTNGSCTSDVGAVDAGCGSYACGTGPACPTSCASDAECAPGHFCNGTSCLPRAANGATCTGDDQCTSEHCVEGVCCNSACSGNCQTCKQSRGATVEGTCGNVTALTDPKSGCASFFCNGVGNCATSCSGTCQTQCKAGAQCSATNCVGLSADGTACTQACQCASNSCTSFFADADGDGSGDPSSAQARSFCGNSPPVGYTTIAGDCCDVDANAHPGQQAFFSAKQGCNSFDYDCVSGEEKESIAQGQLCSYGNDPCNAPCFSGSTVPGWTGSVPSCGAVGTWLTGSCTDVYTPVGGTCGTAIECNTGYQADVVQRCR